MDDSSPRLIIIAGPNGAGKTTFANTYLPEYTNVREFVNADLIAKGLSPFDPASAMIEAGRLFLDRIHHLIEEKTSFAIESTLSGRTYVDLINQAKESGYSTKLYYINLESVELSLERIAHRVKAGGHDVPREVVERRFGRSLTNFFKLYRLTVDDWSLFDNSSNIYKLIAEHVHGVTDVVDSEWYSSLTIRYE